MTPTALTIEERVAALEALFGTGKLPLDKLPLKPLQDRMLADWDPSGKELLLPGSVSTDVLATFPQARVYQAAAATHTSTGNFQKVPMDSTRHDLGALSAQFDDANDRLVCRVAGLYLVHGGVVFAQNAAGRRVAELRKTGTGIAASEDPSTSAVPFPSMQVIDTCRFAVGDYLELFAFQSSGGNLAYAPDVTRQYLGWHWCSR